MLNLIAAGRVELRDRPQQADVAFLDQIQERAAPPDVALGDADHQAQVGADDGTMGFLAARPDLFHFSLQQLLVRQIVQEGGFGREFAFFAFRLIQDGGRFLRQHVEVEKDREALRATPFHNGSLPQSRYPDKPADRKGFRSARWS